MTFAVSVHHSYIEHMTDMFAGRIYERQPSPPLEYFRRRLERERERSYETEEDYSIPIGSRFHPERAPLWQANSSIQATEEWMGRR
jgi:hypothetical protein